MIRKLTYLIVYIFAVFGLIILVAWIFGYPPTKNDNPYVDYEGVAVIIQALSVFVLALTIILQLYNGNKLATRQEQFNEDLTTKQDKIRKDIAENQKNLIERQIDISLFEKRYEVYNSLIKLSAPLYNSVNNNESEDGFYNNFFDRIEVEDVDLQQYKNLTNKIERLESTKELKDSIKSLISKMRLDILKLKAEAYIKRIYTIRRSKFLFNQDFADDIIDFLEVISNLTLKIHLEYESDFVDTFDLELDIEKIRIASNNAITNLRKTLEEILKL